MVIWKATVEGLFNNGQDQNCGMKDVLEEVPSHLLGSL
jgi:hypothetical protein